MLRSVQRLERRGGFRPRLLSQEGHHLRYEGIARIQGTVGDPHEGRTGISPKIAHDRWEDLLQRAVHRPEEGPE